MTTNAASADAAPAGAAQDIEKAPHAPGALYLLLWRSGYVERRRQEPPVEIRLRASALRVFAPDPPEDNPQWVFDTNLELGLTFKHEGRILELEVHGPDAHGRDIEPYRYTMVAPGEGTAEASGLPGGLSAAQVLYQVLSRTGYVRSKRAFARLLRLNSGNVYAYLYDPAPRDDDVSDQEAGRNTGRICASVELLHGWAFAISQSTGVAVDVQLEHTGDLLLLVSGLDADGKPLTPFRYRTSHAPYDFRPPTRWESEWSARPGNAPQE